MLTNTDHPPPTAWTGPSVLSMDDPVGQALDEHQARLRVRPDVPEVMDVHGAAALLLVTEDTVRSWANSGELPAFRIPGAGGRGTFRFKRADLIEFIERLPASRSLPCGCGGTLPDLASAPYDETMAAALDQAAADGRRS